MINSLFQGQVTQTNTFAARQRNGEEIETKGVMEKQSNGKEKWQGNGLEKEKLNKDIN